MYIAALPAGPVKTVSSLPDALAAVLRAAIPDARPRTVVKAEVAVTPTARSPTTRPGRARVEMVVLAPWDWAPDSLGYRGLVTHEACTVSCQLSKVHLLLV